MAKILSSNKCFDGIQATYSHTSLVTNCEMKFGIFLPPQAESSKVPVLFWLSGLTCTHENFIIKAGAQRVASELGIAIVTPDTSPRGLKLPGESDSYDFGTGAGFYLDATQKPWSNGYNMYSYITKELINLIIEDFPIDSSNMGIFGHSMGGHGALTIGIKNQELFRSISAFSPISSPIQSNWGKRALKSYLGINEHAWRQYDSVALIEDIGYNGPELMVDYGTNDEYLKDHLRPELLDSACKKANVALRLRMQDGYDHSYFFISSFIEEHLRFHNSYLRNN